MTHFADTDGPDDVTTKITAFKAATRELPSERSLSTPRSTSARAIDTPRTTER